MISARIFCINLLGLYLIFSKDHSESCITTGSLLLKPNISHLKPSNDKQSLEVTWPRSHRANDIYEIQISRTEEHNVIYSENVSASAGDSDEYSWTWISDLPLECVDHSIRIRIFCNQSAQSPWSNWLVHSGVEAKGKTDIYPFQQVLQEGSTAMFCCVPPAGVHIRSIRFRNIQFPTISIGPRVKAIAVHNLTIPPGRIKSLLITCTEATGKSRSTWNFVSFPPQRPRNLSCVTSDLATVTCTWDSGRKRDPHDRSNQTHTLHIVNSEQAPIKCKPSFCSFPVVPQLQEYNISVVVRNKLGEAMESYSFNLSERVYPVLEWDRVIPGVTNVSMSWSVRGNVTRANYSCQISLVQDTSHHAAVTQLSCNSGLCKVSIRHLHPNTWYSTRVCCSVNGRLWGKWTPPVNFTTYPLVTLDLWRQIQQPADSHLRHVTLLWKPHIVGKAATVNIQGYALQWSQEGQIWTEMRDAGQNRAKISISAGKWDLTVQAVLQSGSSIPAHITIPPAGHTETLPIKSRWSGTSAGGSSLSWDQQSSATCGYTVEWCLLGRAVPCALEWVNVPKENNSLLLPAGHFAAGCRYSFNIYECTENGHRLLEVKTGYSQELNSVQAPSLVDPVQSTSSSVTLEWRYKEDDPTHPAFITGYLVTVKDGGAHVRPGPAAYLANVSVVDPQQKSVTIAGLQQNQEYFCSLSALTKVGPGIPVNITIRTRTNYASHLAEILTPLFFLLGCSILLRPQLKMLKSRLKEIFAYPAGMNIKTPEFESFLYETHQRLQTQRADECICCDVEILNVKPLLSQTSSNGNSEPANMQPSPGGESCSSSVSPSCEPVQAGYCPQSAIVLRDRLVLQPVTSITNKSYFSTTNENQEPMESRSSEVGFSFEPAGCLQDSCDVIYGYISGNT